MAYKFPADFQSGDRVEFLPNDVRTVATIAEQDTDRDGSLLWIYIKWEGRSMLTRLRPDREYRLVEETA